MFTVAYNDQRNKNYISMNVKNLYHGSELTAFLDNSSKSGKIYGAFLETDWFCLKVKELLEEWTKITALT